MEVITATSQGDERKTLGNVRTHCGAPCSVLQVLLGPTKDLRPASNQVPEYTHGLLKLIEICSMKKLHMDFKTYSIDINVSFNSIFQKLYEELSYIHESIL